MDVVESITFTRKEVIDGKEITASALYIPSADNAKPRSDWKQEEIDAIGETLSPDLDATLKGIK
jgi:hypothetical protein